MAHKNISLSGEDAVYYDEQHFTFALSLLYGITPDCAKFIIDNAGDMDFIKERLGKMASSFFEDEEKYNKMLTSAILKAKRTELKEFKKLGVSNTVAKANMKLLDSKYTEFKGFLTLGLVTEADHPLLIDFINKYAPYCYEERTKKANAIYEMYKKGKLTEKELKNRYNYTVKKLMEAIDY